MMKTGRRGQFDRAEVVMKDMHNVHLLAQFH